MCGSWYSAILKSPPENALRINNFPDDPDSPVSSTVVANCNLVVRTYLSGADGYLAVNEEHLLVHLAAILAFLVEPKRFPSQKYSQSGSEHQIYNYCQTVCLSESRHISSTNLNLIWTAFAHRAQILLFFF